MTNQEQYQIMSKYPNFISYLFDKITCLFIKSKSNKIRNPKKILLLRNDHIGDLVQNTHIFRELKEAFPKSKITVLATKTNRVVIEKDKYVDEILEGERFWDKRTFKSFLDYLKVLKKIRKEKFDIGIDLRMSRLNIFFFLFVPKIKSRISYYNINGGKAFLTHPTLYDKKINVIYETPKLLKEHLGIKIKNYLPHIMTDKKDENYVGKFLRKNKLKDYIVLCPASTNECRKWPEKKFAQLINLFHKKYPKYRIIISSGQGDKALINRLCKNKKFCMPLINFNLRMLSIIFKKSKVVIGNDGGAASIAWVSGGNLVLLEGPVDLSIHMPFGNFKILQHKLPCYPCNWSKPCKKPYGKWCMDLITVKEVLREVDGFMKVKKNSQTSV